MMEEEFVVALYSCAIFKPLRETIYSRKMMYECLYGPFPAQAGRGEGVAKQGSEGELSVV